MMIPYGLLGSGIQHCRVILERPVRLKTSRGRLVAVLQPVASTNHLFFVPGTTQGAFDDGGLPVLLCDSELGALAALQLSNDDLPILPVGLGGSWGWRKTAIFDDPDGGTKLEKGPVEDLKEKIARKGRRIIVAFASDTDKDAGAKGARAALVKFLKKTKVQSLRPGSAGRAARFTAGSRAVDCGGWRRGGSERDPEAFGCDFDFDVLFNAGVRGVG
jgi:hypothetical protein